MKIIEEKILISISIIMLIGITLNSLLIQNTNKHINDYYTDLLLTENDLLNTGNLALYNYMMVLRLEVWKSKNELICDQNLTELDKTIEEYDNKITKYVNLYNIGAAPLRIKIDNQPNCILNINCSEIITILTSIQYCIIALLFLLYTHLFFSITKRIRNKGSGS